MQEDCNALVTKIASKKRAPLPKVGPAKVAIATAPRMGGSGPILYGSIGDREGAKEWLTTQLLSRLMSLAPHGAPLRGKGLPTIEEDSLGKPFLFWPGASVPAISFSHAQGRTWAAMAWCSGVGIDAAFPEEFHGHYPLARAFRSRELDQGLDLCRGDLHDAAALIWSLKEAAVKAAGWGFNLLDPLEVEVGVPMPWADGFIFEVNARGSLSAWARRDGRAWVAIALLA
jgi:hypothetical protein